MSLSGLLNQFVILYPQTSYDEWGSEVVGAGVEYKARVQQVTKTRFLPDGKTLTIDLLVHLEGNPDTKANDRLDYSGKRYIVHKKNVSVDGRGVDHHTRLECIKYNV